MSTSVFIVGGNRGLGLGLVEEQLGKSDSTVFTTTRNPKDSKDLDALVSKYPQRLFVFQMDMLDDSSVKAAVGALQKHTESLDTIILNAATLVGQGRLEDLSAADLLANLNGNIVGPHELIKAFYPFLLKGASSKKTVVLISSLGASLTMAPQVAAFVKKGFNVPFVPLSGYAVSKAGANMLARQWQDVLEPQGIQVAIIHPGSVSTRMNPAPDAITPRESAAGLLSELAKLTPELTGKGILAYDGTDPLPW